MSIPDEIRMNIFQKLFYITIKKTFPVVFKVIPNVEWLANNKIIQNVFRECGFSVHVERKKSMFWNYIYVYGIKTKDDYVFI